MINKIKNIIIKNNLDGYIVPKNDKFFTEYSKVSNLELVANFNGSAGFAIILKKKIIFLLMEDIQFKQKNNRERNSKYLRFLSLGQEIFLAILKID